MVFDEQFAPSRYSLCVSFDVTGSWESCQDVTVTARHSLDLSSLYNICFYSNRNIRVSEKSHSHNAVL